MSTVFRGHVVVLLLALSALSGLSQAATPAAAKPLLSAIIEAVTAKGPNSQIPPHLSAVLGISAVQQSTPVKQAVMRARESTHTFNVSTDQHEDVVLMNYDARSGATTAYLTNSAGTLRKAVSYLPGKSPIERKADDARKQFQAELDFWLNLSKSAAPAHR